MPRVRANPDANRFSVAFDRYDGYHVRDRFGNVLDSGYDSRLDAQRQADEYNRMEHEGDAIRDEVIGS